MGEVIPMPKKKKELKQYQCQFCEKFSLASAWEDKKDHCPRCGKQYDAILAQEGDGG